MKKFFKGLLWIIAVFLITICVLIACQSETENDIDFSSFSTTDSPQEQTTDTAPEETNGGNNGDVQYTYYKVTVSDDRYFTSDGELTLDELIDEISVLGEDYAVEIVDDNATLKAYNELTDKLDGISVPYMEDDEIQ